MNLCKIDIYANLKILRLSNPVTLLEFNNQQKLIPFQIALKKKTFHFNMF